MNRTQWVAAAPPVTQALTYRQVNRGWDTGDAAIGAAHRQREVHLSQQADDRHPITNTSDHRWRA